MFIHSQKTLKFQSVVRPTAFCGLVWGFKGSEKGKQNRLDMPLRPTWWPFCFFLAQWLPRWTSHA